MSTGATQQPPAKKKKKKTKSPSILEIAFANFWKLLVGVVVLFLLVSSLFHGGGDVRPEPFNPQRMSQVPRIWPARAWAAPQEMQAAQPSLLTRALRSAEVTLGNGLKSVPQYEGEEWQYVPWHGLIPQRKESPPFQFYDQWAEGDCSNR